MLDDKKFYCRDLFTASILKSSLPFYRQAETRQTKYVFSVFHSFADNLTNKLSAAFCSLTFHYKKVFFNFVTGLMLFGGAACLIFASFIVKMKQDRQNMSFLSFTLLPII